MTTRAEASGNQFTSRQTDFGEQFMHIEGTRRCDTQHTYNYLQLFYEMTCKEGSKYS